MCSHADKYKLLQGEKSLAMHVDDSGYPHRDDPAADSDRTSHGSDFAGRHATVITKAPLPITLFSPFRFSATQRSDRSTVALHTRPAFSSHLPMLPCNSNSKSLMSYLKLDSLLPSSRSGSSKFSMEVKIF